MNAVLRYLAFVGVLAAASYAAATFDVKAGLPTRSMVNNQQLEHSAPLPSLSGKPAHQLGGLAGQAVVDYNPTGKLTAAAVADTLKIWQLPDETPQLDFDTGDDSRVLALKFIPARGLLAVGVSSADGLTGGIRLFDLTSAKMTLQVDEPEPVVALDLHPGGGYLLVTANSYLKVINLKDGATLALLPKDTPVSRGYFYGGGSNVLLSSSLALVDVNTQKKVADLDTVPPLMVRKNGASGRISWLTAEGLASQIPNGKKNLFPLQTKGIIAFDIEPQGKWGLFLLEDQKLAELDISSGKVIKTVSLSSPAVDVSINPDGASAAVVLASGEIAIFDIGSSNRIRNLRFQTSKVLHTITEKISELFARVQR